MPHNGRKQRAWKTLIKMLGRQRRIDYDIFRIRSIIRNNPGITPEEIAIKLNLLDKNKWYRRKVYRRLNKMNGIKVIMEYNKEINRQIYKYFIE